ncbi:MAG: TRL domain-containing protein [Nitrospiria bacterium]
MATKVNFVGIFISKLTIPVLAALILGCGSIGSLYTYNGSGLLYTHKIVPLTHHYFPIQTGQINNDSKGDNNQLSFKSITLQMGDNGIGEIAKKAGIETIYYADLEIQSILLGIWSRSRVHIYGTVKPLESDSPYPKVEKPP